VEYGVPERKVLILEGVNGEGAHQKNEKRVNVISGGGKSGRGTETTNSGYSDRKKGYYTRGQEKDSPGSGHAGDK